VFSKETVKPFTDFDAKHLKGGGFRENTFFNGGFRENTTLGFILRF